MVILQLRKESSISAYTTVRQHVFFLKPHMQAALSRIDLLKHNIMSTTGRWSRMPSNKRNGNHPSAIPPKMVQPEDPGLPSLAKLDDDVILLILEAVHDSHPTSLPIVCLVCSHLNLLAAYISSRRLKLDLCSDAESRRKTCSSTSRRMIS